MFKLGTVIHYYEKVGSAIVELEGMIAVGDKIKFVKDGETLFDQSVQSIQVGHDKLDSANRGDVIALKTNEVVEKGTEIFKEGLVG